MEIPPKLVVVIIIGSALLGGAIERAIVGPDKTETNIVEKEVVRNKIITRIVERHHIDGSIDKEIVIDDGSIIRRNKDTDVVVTTSKVSNWYVHAAAGMKLRYVERIYSVGIDRRILGPIWLGLYGTTQEEVGLRVGVQF